MKTNKLNKEPIVSYREINVGDTVRVKKTKETANVVRIVDGGDGAVILDRKIRGYTYYHRKELDVVKI